MFVEHAVAHGMQQLVVSARNRFPAPAACCARVSAPGPRDTLPSPPHSLPRYAAASDQCNTSPRLAVPCLASPRYTGRTSSGAWRSSVALGRRRRRRAGHDWEAQLAPHRSATPLCASPCSSPSVLHLERLFEIGVPSWLLARKLIGLIFGSPSALAVHLRPMTPGAPCLKRLRCITPAGIDGVLCPSAPSAS